MGRMKKPRGKKEAGDTRQAILDAAERRMSESGPGGIRLQEVAADVGVSHPAVLHHFGSREGLVHAVVDRAIRSLQADLASAIVEQSGTPQPDGAALFERVVAVLFDKGHARLLAWLLLSGHDPLASDESRAGWERIAEMTHAMRVAGTPKGKKAPSYEDTRFTIVLSALALFGEAIAGRATFDLAGLGRSPAVERRFRTWFAEMLSAHLRGLGVEILPDERDDSPPGGDLDELQQLHAAPAKRNAVEHSALLVPTPPLCDRVGHLGARLDLCLGEVAKTSAGEQRGAGLEELPDALGRPGRRLANDGVAREQGRYRGDDRDRAVAIVEGREEAAREIIDCLAITDRRRDTRLPPEDRALARFALQHQGLFEAHPDRFEHAGRSVILRRRDGEHPLAAQHVARIRKTRRRRLACVPLISVARNERIPDVDRREGRATDEPAHAYQCVVVAAHHGPQSVTALEVVIDES